MWIGKADLWGRGGWKELETQRERTKYPESVLLPGLPLVLQVFIPGFPECCYNRTMPLKKTKLELPKFAFYLLSPKEF